MKMPRRRKFGSPRPAPMPGIPKPKPVTFPLATKPRATPAVPPSTPGQRATPAVPAQRPARLPRPVPAAPVKPVTPSTPAGLQKLHTVVNRETGETMQITQQAWKDMTKGSDATFRRGGPNLPKANKGRKP